MTQSLFNKAGTRKYLVARERSDFVAAAVREPESVALFCLTLAITGARISEVLALTLARVDAGNSAIVFETLKQRRSSVFRAVPIPEELAHALKQACSRKESEKRLWPWGRTNAWKIVKRVLRKAGVAESICMPKALRHGFAVEAGQNGVPLNIVQRWLGHARIETTAIYSGAIGDEERELARRSWQLLDSTSFSAF